MATSFTDWEGACLAHHGIKGQKWGVRRFQNPDGSYTEAGRARLSREYGRASKKLGKLERRTNIGQQRKDYIQYKGKAIASAKRAGKLGLAAAATYAVGRSGTKALRALSNAQLDASYAYSAAKQALDGKGKLGYYERSLRDSHQNAALMNKFEGWSSSDKAKKFSEGASLAFYGLSGAALAEGGKAAYNAVRAKAAKSRTTSKGHRKAVKKYKAQYEKMVNQFKDTPYSELLKKQKKG